MSHHREKYLVEQEAKFNRMTGTEQIEELYRLVREVERRLDSNCNVLLETLESHKKDGVARFEITNINNKIDILISTIYAQLNGQDIEFFDEIENAAKRANTKLAREKEKSKAYAKYSELKFQMQELMDTYKFED